jgi:hypothetical protein
MAVMYDLVRVLSHAMIWSALPITSAIAHQRLATRAHVVSTREPGTGPRPANQRVRRFWQGCFYQRGLHSAQRCSGPVHVEMKHARDCNIADGMHSLESPDRDGY